MTRICFDYDAIAYQTGFAAETRSIVVTHKNSKDSWEFSNRTEFWGRDRKGGWLEQANAERESPWDVSEFDVQDKQEMKDPALVQDILNTKIASVCKALASRDYYGWMSNGKVFRSDVATITEYKNNRKDSLKPLALDLIRDMLLSYHNGKLATHMLEADDWLSIDSVEAWKDWSKTKHKNDRLVVVTPDKDARGCCQSHLYNPDRMRLPKTINGYGSLYWRDDTSSDKLDGHGRVWLYLQVIFGDLVDTYSGKDLYVRECKRLGVKPERWGEVAAYNLLKDCKNDKEALTAIVGQYKKWYPEPVTYLSWNGKEYTKDWLGVVEEMWQLARMKRWAGDDVPFQEVLEKTGVKYE